MTQRNDSPSHADMERASARPLDDNRGAVVTLHPASFHGPDYSSILMIGQFTTTPIGPQDFPSGPVM